MFTPLAGIDDHFPLPIALTYHKLAQALAGAIRGAEKFLLLRDCYETLSRYIALALVAIYVQSTERSETTDRDVIRRLVRPSTGDWPSLITDIAPMLKANQFGLAAHRALFEQPAHLMALREFPSVRNELLGHGLTRGNAEYESAIAIWGEKLNQVLSVSSFLSDWNLVYVAGVADGELWMGYEQPDRIVALDAAIPASLAGKLILARGADAISLTPFFMRLKCPECNAVRLCIYDSQHSYEPTKKKVRLLEFPEAHRFSSAEPITALEAAFQPALLEQEYKAIYARLKDIQGNILDQTAIIEQHPDVIGRAFIDQQIEQFLGLPSSRVFMLTGQPGIGKTAYLARYARNHPDCIRFFFSRAGGSSLVDDAVFSLYYQVLIALGIGDKTPPIDARECRTKLHNLLENFPGRGLQGKAPLLLIIDALDEATTSSALPRVLDLLSLE
jgi:hypothetical protein